MQEALEVCRRRFPWQIQNGVLVGRFNNKGVESGDKLATVKPKRDLPGSWR